MLKVSEHLTAPLGHQCYLVRCVCVCERYLVFGVEHHGLCVWDPADVVLVLGGRQPHSGRQLVVEQRQF